jgi:hypothetical protein
LRRLKQKYSFDLISLGQEVFLERMRTLDFATWAGLTKVKRALERLRRLGLTALAARVLLWLQAWHPIILTLKKHEDD